MQYKIYALALPFDLRCESGKYCIILYRSLKLLRRNEDRVVTLLIAVVRYVVCVFRFVEVSTCVDALVGNGVIFFITLICGKKNTLCFFIAVTDSFFSLTRYMFKPLLSKLSLSMANLFV